MVSLEEIKGVTLEENSERVKIVLPVKRQGVYLGIYTILLLVWLAMLVVGIIFTVQIAFSGERFAFTFSVMLVIFLFVLYWLGKTVWRQWQYFAATREILFVFTDHMVIRRPLSLLGITTAYDREHIRPFYYDDDQQSPAFEYGRLYVLFGQSLQVTDAGTLIGFLNGHYFPDYDDEQ